MFNSESSDYIETESFDSNQLPALKIKLKDIAEVETKQDNELDEEEWQQLAQFGDIDLLDEEVQKQLKINK